MALAILVVPVLSGCAVAENGPSSAEARGEAVAEPAEGLKREDEEAELKQIVDRDTTPEERAELREEIEVEQPEQAQEQSERAQEQRPETEPEGGSEREQEPESEPEQEQS